MNPDYDKPATEYFSKQQDYDKPAPESFRKQGNQWTPVDSLAPTSPPITPPPELVQKWIGNYYGCPVSGELAGVETAIAACAAQWGADMELEACCADIHTVHGSTVANWLRAMRRPKPPSLKEQALMALEDGDTGPGASLTSKEVDIIRAALEALPND
jgi:hypothetical protein